MPLPPSSTPPPLPRRCPPPPPPPLHRLPRRPLRLDFGSRHFAPSGGGWGAYVRFHHSPSSSSSSSPSSTSTSTPARSGVDVDVLVDQETVAHFQQSLRPTHPSCLYPPLSPPSELVRGVAMSTSAVTPLRSLVQTPIFSVSPSSFSLSPI